MGKRSRLNEQTSVDMSKTADSGIDEQQRQEWHGPHIDPNTGEVYYRGDPGPELTLPTPTVSVKSLSRFIAALPEPEGGMPEIVFPYDSRIGIHGIAFRVEPGDMGIGVEWRMLLKLIPPSLKV